MRRRFWLLIGWVSFLDVALNLSWLIEHGTNHQALVACLLPFNAVTAFYLLIVDPVIDLAGRELKT